MLEQRLQQRPRLILLPPALLVLAIALLTIIFARSDGSQPRELIFDTYMRVAAPAAGTSSDIAIIDIDQESLSMRGPWPWPRSALAQLINQAFEADAAGVVTTIPVEGMDPLSPELMEGFIPESATTPETRQAISTLPSTNILLADAASALPTALGLGQSFDVSPWARSTLDEIDWLTAGPNRTTTYLALPDAPVAASIAEELREAASLAVAPLPVDPDGKTRRAPVLWSLNNLPVPSAGLAPYILRGETVHMGTTSRDLRVGGPAPTAISIGEADALPLGSQGSLRFWPARENAIQTVPAWRVFEGGSWTGPLSGKIVFIGETVSGASMVETSRGPMSVTHFHALLSEQIAKGLSPHRPGWSGPVEAFLAMLAGAIAIAAAMYARPAIVALISLGITIFITGLMFVLFAQTGLLLDPGPVAAASIGAPLTILGVVVGNILLRDDALRGAFHGALPAQTMSRLQTGSGHRLLNGVRREVTVLSCRLRIPQEVIRKFENRPDDFIRFTASANDLLRKTILAHQGTVDFGEDGRLLAYWNVPEKIEHPVEKACACALQMIDDINTLSDNVQTAAFSQSRNRGLDIGFADTTIEIGLSSTMCFAGPVGRGSRNRYSVIGDAVGIASALRTRANMYGPTIITDDIVFDALRHHYAFLDLDVLHLSKDTQPRTIYGLVGNPFLKASKSFRQLADIQRELVLSWRSANLAQVTIQLQRLRALPGVPDVYVDLFDTRLVRARGLDEEKTQDLIETLDI